MRVQEIRISQETDKGGSYGRHFDFGKGTGTRTARHPDPDGGDLPQSAPTEGAFLGGRAPCALGQHPAKRYFGLGKRYVS